VNSRIHTRARRREDRNGDPLDGLVNLFDLGIVLAVAFLLAALSSIDVSPAALERENRRPADAVVVKPTEETKTVPLKPGERVVGRGEPVGTVYRLDDGRTVLVQPKQQQPGQQQPTQPDNKEVP
jgi:hypothetical protein